MLIVQDYFQLLFQVELEILMEDRQGILARVVSTIANLKTNIRQMDSRTEDGKATAELVRQNELLRRQAIELTGREVFPRMFRGGRADDGNRRPAINAQTLPRLIVDQQPSLQSRRPGNKRFTNHSSHSQCV